MGNIWSLGLEKPLRAQRITGCSVETWKVKILKRQTVGLACRPRGKQMLIRADCVVFKIPLGICGSEPFCFTETVRLALGRRNSCD